MPTFDDCRAEIESLHEFFVRWYCGETDRSAIDQLERALAPDFERVSPDGTLHDKTAICSGVESTYNEHEQFSIDIRNVDPVTRVGDCLLVRYEEWQETPMDSNGRLSTVLFEPASDADTPTPSTVQWRYLQETWLDAPSSND